MSYLFYILLGIAPSVVWLLFYLHKDANPEPKKTVLLVFLGGAFMGPIALLLQFSVIALISPSSQWLNIFASLGQNQYLFLLNVLAIAPLSEEVLKYLVVKWQVLKNPNFDEPLDAMIYLIISALGFAATENLLNIFLIPNITLQLAGSQALIRFVSATFLHTLTSGVLGFFIAYSMLNFKNRNYIFAVGFLLAASLHGAYNYLAWLFSSKQTTALALVFSGLAGRVGRHRQLAIPLFEETTVNL